MPTNQIPTTESFTPIDGGPHGRPEATLARGLGVGSIVFMVVAAAAPLTVAAAVTPIVFSTSQSATAPLYFIAAAVILALFAVGFTRMSLRVPNAGAFYSYIAVGLGRIPGVGAATLSLFSYFILLVGVYTLLGAQTSNALGIFFGIDTPWWLWSLLAWLFVAFLGYRDIELSAKVLAVALIAEALVVLILNVAILIQGGESGLSAAPFNPTGLFTDGAPLGLLFAILGFIGFEATAVFRNEARDPERTVPRATYIAVISIGVFYAFSAWCTAIGVGVDNAVSLADEDPDNMVLNLAVSFIAPWFLTLMQTLVVTSILACALAFHNVGTRYLFTLSGFQLLPAFLGRVSEKHRSPSAASLFLSALSVVVILVFVPLGLDPVGEVYTWLSGTASLGLVALMGLTSFATIVSFRRHRIDASPWVTVVAPLAATAAFVAIAVIVLANFSSLVGSITAAWILGPSLVLSYLVGVALALIVRRRHGERYRALVQEVPAREPVN